MEEVLEGLVTVFCCLQWLAILLAQGRSCSLCLWLCLLFVFIVFFPRKQNRERDEREREIYNERNPGSTMGAMASYPSRPLSIWSLPRQASVALLYCFGCHIGHQSSSFYHGMEASPWFSTITFKVWFWFWFFSFLLFLFFFLVLFPVPVEGI